MAASVGRWDNDNRGRGIADGAWIAPQVRDLLAGLTAPAWVAEDPDDHLLPNLRQACADAASPWTLVETDLRDGVYVVALAWSRPAPRLGRLRADLFALLGEIAESTTFVRQRLADDAIEYDVTTGMLDGDGFFAGHGHLLCFRIGGSDIGRLVAGAHRVGDGIVEIDQVARRSDGTRRGSRKGGDDEGAPDR